jgi:hypothetical protein
MRKRILIGLAGAGLVLVGLVAGMLIGGRLPAFAAGSTHHAVVATGSGATKYCQIYEQTLANDLNVDTTALEKANLDAAQKTLDQMVKDGQITATEQAQLASLLQQVGTQPCTNLSSKTIATYLRHDPLVGQQLLAARTVVTNAVAQALGLTPDALQSDLSAGQTVAQIAHARNVPLATVNKAYLNAVKSFLDQNVSGGVITQEQSDAAYKLIAQAIAGGHYPLLDAGGK